MDQIENAVNILHTPSSPQDVKQQAFDYLGHLRSNPEGWQACTNLLVRKPRASEVVRVVCLDVVNNAIHTQSLGAESLAFLKLRLWEHVWSSYGPNAADNEPDSIALQGKLAQTLTYLFVFLYKTGWQEFIDDFLHLAALEKDNVNGVLLYLRVLGSVHDEIADMLLARGSNDAKRNTELKDRVRDHDMDKIAKSWQDILARYTNKHGGIVEAVLKVVGKWVGWMDISLVIHPILTLLLPIIGRTNPSSDEDKVRNAAIDTLNDMCAKRMKLSDKMDLISFINLREIVATLVHSRPLDEFRSTHKYDNDLAESVARLVNTVMSESVRAMEDQSLNPATRERADQHVRSFEPFLLRFLSDEYDEVCSIVIPSLTDLLTALRRLTDRPRYYMDMLPPILSAVMMKMKYDETSSWGREEEQMDEAEFLDLRKKLLVLQKLIESIDQKLFIHALCNLVGTAFQNLAEEGSSMDWRDLDLALHELFLFGELAVPQGGNKKTEATMASDELFTMMRNMIESGMCEFSHPAVQIQYMELCVRYCSFFESNEDCIPRVLESFIRLVHHNHVRVKARSWYLFFRYVRHVRAFVGDVAETVIGSIQDLLPIKAEAPSDDADNDMSSDETDNSADALFQSQLYLYETVGCIASTPHTPAETRAMYIRAVMDPLFSDMENHLTKAKSGDAQAIQQIHHIIMALGTLAYGYSQSSPESSDKQVSPPLKAVADEFARAAEAILISLGQLNASDEIRQASRSAFARLLGVLGPAVLPQLPQWIEGLLSQSSSKDEMAMFLRLLGQVVFGFKGEIYGVLNALLTPLLQRCFGGLSEPIAGTDDEIQLVELRREYLTFLQSLLNNNLEGVFISDTNQAFFEPTMTSILEIACAIDNNLMPNKLAFNLMIRIASIWGGPDVGTIAANPASPVGTSLPVIPGFDRFLIDRFHGACWNVMQNGGFKPASDAQSSQLLAEIAGLEQMIYIKTGQMFINHLQQTLIPGLGIDGSEFLHSLTTSTDRKQFSTYLGKLLKDRR